jgi:hypothetical protein
MKAILMAVFLVMIMPLLVFSADQRATPGTGNPQSQREIASLREGLQNLKIETDNEIGSLQQMVQASFSGVSTQLAAANHFFGIVATVVALVAIGLGLYMTYLAKRMADSYTKAQALLKKSESVKTEVDQLNEMIKSNWSKLYREIKEEETKYIIARLKKEPRDITNFGTILESRDLSNEYYTDLKACLLSLLPDYYTDRKFREEYILIFFRHYAGLAFFDAQLADVLKSNSYICFRNAFNSDILSITKDLVNASIERDFRKEGEELIEFMGALRANVLPQGGLKLEDVLSIVWEGLISKANRFAFYQMMPDAGYYLDFKVIHGRKLVEKYGTLGNSESENLILTEAKGLLVAAQGGEANA